MRRENMEPTPEVKKVRIPATPKKKASSAANLAKARAAKAAKSIATKVQNEKKRLAPAREMAEEDEENDAEIEAPISELEPENVTPKSQFANGTFASDSDDEPEEEYVLTKTKRKQPKPKPAPKKKAEAPLTMLQRVNAAKTENKSEEKPKASLVRSFGFLSF